MNAIGHRDYSISGTDIQIKMFDDHFTVESPGTLPGLVRTSNIREIHFSRNPKIFEFLHEYEYVKEFGEGVDRMYREMDTAGLPEPEYRTVEFMLYATIKNQKWVENHRDRNTSDIPQVTAIDTTTDNATDTVIGTGTDMFKKREMLVRFCTEPRSSKEILAYLGLSNKQHLHKNYLKPLLAEGKLKMTIPDKPNSRNQKYIKA